MMAPTTVTLWAWTLLFCEEWFKVVERWQLGGFYKCLFWVGVGFSTLYLSVASVVFSHMYKNVNK